MLMGREYLRKFDGMSATWLLNVGLVGTVVKLAVKPSSF